jgi:hypothetical protein
LLNTSFGTCHVSKFLLNLGFTDDLTPVDKEAQIALDKITQERKAAIRALTTNFCIFFIFCLPNIAVLIKSPWARFFFTTNLSFHKCMMPVLTTIANFGTIREVCLKYWISLKEKWQQ